MFKNLKILKEINFKPIEFSVYQILSLNFKILDSKDNLANGEIEKFNFVESCKGGHRRGDQITGQKHYQEENKYYDCIWICIITGQDWYKMIGKYEQSPWTCQ